jgi:hypothetical protein
MKFRISFSIAVVSVMLGLVIHPASAQLTESTLKGSVVDPTGSVVQYANIVATNESIGISRTATSGNDGSFTITDLAPGKYSVQVKAQGYKTFAQTHLQLNVGTTTQVNARLEVGQIQETVEVLADQSQVAVSKDGRLSDTLNEAQITQLPIPVRDAFFLPSLNAGATNIPGANFSYKMTNSPSVTVNGNRYRGNNYVLDGSMNTNTLNEGEPGIVPSLESIEEVQVQTGNFSSEFGRGNGSVVNMRTRSGTNEFHGKAWEYLKNAALNARNYFATQTTPQVFNQFGARFGGPINKSKTFFFGSYEGTRNALAQALSYQVETPEFRNYVFNTAPQSIAATLLKGFPAPTPVSGGATEYLNETDITTPQNTVIPATGTVHEMLRDYLRYDQYLIHVDHSFNGGNDTLTGRWISEFERGKGATNSQVTTLAEAMRGFLDPYNGVFGNLNVGETHVFHHNVNDARLSFQDDIIDYGRPFSQYPVLNITGINAPFGDPGAGGLNSGSRIRTYEYRDTLTSTFGRHLLRYGGEYRRLFIAINIAPPRVGNYSFNSLLAFAADNPYQQTLVVDPATGKTLGLERDYSANETGAYLQDDWKVNSRLTINAGVRWDYFGGPSERYGKLASITFGQGTTFAERLANASAGQVSSLFHAQKTNFSPRVGLAYDPFGDGKSSIRAGFSLSYEPIHGLTLLSGAMNPPFAVQIVLQPNAGYGTNILYGIPVPYNPEFKVTLNAQGGIVSPAGTPSMRISPWLIDPKLKTQYSENWFLSLQHEFARGWIAELGYVGTNGVNLERRDDINRFNGDLLVNNGVQKRINQNWAGITYATNGVTSNYNGMTAEIRHQASRTLMVQANYRWSKWFDDESDTSSSFFSDNSQGGRGAQDASCLKCERGRSEFDIPKRFTASAIWLPEYFKGHSLLARAAENWQISTIVAVQSGRPFSVYCSASFQAGCDWKADGGGAIGNGYYDRPMAPAKGTVKSKFSQKEYVNGLFDPNVFPIPVLGTNGTLKRDAFRGSRQINTNLAIERSFKITESKEFHMQWQAFNVLNTTNLYMPNGDMALALKPDKTFSTSSSFGKSTQAFDPRIMQVSATFSF